MQKNEIDYRVWEDGKMKHYLLKNATFMKYTGHWDHYGNKIYEGDVVRVMNLFRQGDIRYIKVQYDKKRMGWNLGEYKKPGHDFEVVGHIFENKKW